MHHLKAVLANPYAQTANNAYPSHYLHAYGGVSWPLTNAQGYTLSSTYIPGTLPHSRNLQLEEVQSLHSPTPRSRPSQQHTPSWYQTGNVKCTYKGCTFTGSRKSVEIHNMDRHLIYPPGWKHRERKGDWDADPSLKGYVMAKDQCRPSCNFSYSM